MAAHQTRLLPAPQPLVDRFGVEFFRNLPRSPGIYRMFDEHGVLVYVGKAANLHARLASYRRTHAQSRKTIRLIHAVRRIEWEVCPTEAEARLRENEWIRTYRPRFNRVGTWPASARYVVLQSFPSGFTLSTSDRAEPIVQVEPTTPTDSPSPGFPALAAPVFFPDPTPARPPIACRTEVFGAFRGGPAQALGALARTLWMAWNRPLALSAMPHELTRPPRRHTVVARHPEADPWLQPIRQFFQAESDHLIAQLITAIPEPASPFDQAFLALQIETLADFYRRGPVRNRRLRITLAPDSTLLAPEELDDFSVRVPPSAAAPAFRPDP